MNSFEYEYFNNISTFFTPTPRKRKLNKYAIILNETKVEGSDAEKKPCSLAAELLPGVKPDKPEDLIRIIGEILEEKIKIHAKVARVAFMKPDKIIEYNSPNLVPIMYRIAAENFVQKDMTTFKIIECPNSTKLLSDWKPSLPDKLISFGHQVIVVQLETSYVPHTDFAYAILRQLDFDWKARLPRSFFFPDDVCKVEATPERDLCVVSPSMPDGDLEINKKLGTLKYELLQMIKSSCMSAMKNYLMKRDLRVGKFSDTMDGVSALRQLYRRLQDLLHSGEEIDLRSSVLEDIKMLAKQSLPGADVLAGQTCIEYGQRLGFSVPSSRCSTARSCCSSRASEINSDSEMEDIGDDDNDGDGNCEKSHALPGPPSQHTSSSGTDKDDGRDCQSSLKNGGESGNKMRGKGYDDNDPKSSHPTNSQQPKVDDGSREDDADEGGLRIEDFTEFRESLECRYKRSQSPDSGGEEEDDDEDFDYSYEFFSADSITQLLRNAAGKLSNMTPRQ